MLGKLLKYEIKATARWFLPIYAALVLLAVVGRVFWSVGGLEDQLYRGSGSFDNHFTEIMIGLLITLFFTMLLALSIISVVIMIQRFHKNLLGDEGYLMFTLPVSATGNINCKLLVSLMWGTLSVLLVLLIGFLSFFSLRNTEWMGYLLEEAYYSLETFFESLKMAPAVYVVEIVAASLLSTASSILQVYAAIAIGHLANRRRVLLAFGAYIGIGWAQQVILSIAATVLDWGEYLGNVWWYEGGESIFHISIGINAASSLVFGAVFYVLTAFILNKRLNLE